VERRTSIERKRERPLSLFFPLRRSRRAIAGWETISVLSIFLLARRSEVVQLVRETVSVFPPLFSSPGQSRPPPTRHSEEDEDRVFSLFSVPLSIHLLVDRAFCGVEADDLRASSSPLFFLSFLPSAQLEPHQNAR